MRWVIFEHTITRETPTLFRTTWVPGGSVNPAKKTVGKNEFMSVDPHDMYPTGFSFGTYCWEEDIPAAKLMIVEVVGEYLRKMARDVSENTRDFIKWRSKDADSATV